MGIERARACVTWPAEVGSRRRVVGGAARDPRARSMHKHAGAHAHAARDEIGLVVWVLIKRCELMMLCIYCLFAGHYRAQ